MSNFLRRYQENTRLLNTLKIVADIAIIIVAAYVIILFTCYRTNISGNSMQPVLCNNDTVLINKFAYAYSSPKRYDVIAFKTSESAFDKIYIKRVIGVPGDKVLSKMEKSTLMINNWKMMYLQIIFLQQVLPRMNFISTKMNTSV